MLKNRVKKLCLLLFAALLCVSCALADENAFCDEPPAEVRAHISGRWRDWELEDYVLVEDTPEGDYGFALLNKGRARMLVGYHEQNGKMAYWLKSEPVAPQGEGHGWLETQRKGEQSLDARTDQYVTSDGLTFSIRTIVPDSENDYRGLRFNWKNGGFKLASFHDYTAYFGTAYVEDGYLDYWGWGEWRHEANVYGILQTDLRYVDFAALPKSPEQARKTLSAPPEIAPGGALTAKTVKFEGGKKYDVYTGPGKDYQRSGSGKGSVSTNDWIQVFGEKDGYLMIQYDLSADRCRIGWIEASALPKGKTVEPLTFLETGATLTRDCDLTDEPIRGQTALASFDAGTHVTLLSTLDSSWAYVRGPSGTVCGFVPRDALAVSEE